MPNDSGRVRVFQGLQQDTNLLTRIAREIAPSGFDIIIDDASHIAELTRISFWHLFESHPKFGGIFVIEDWGPDIGTIGGTENSMSDCSREARRFTPDQREEFFLLRGRTVGKDKEQYKAISHSYGMVGLVKELIDDCGMEEITYPNHGTKPGRNSRFESIMITHGQVIIRKANRSGEE